MEYDQAIEIQTVIPNQETTSICKDWMVEQREFEPPTSSIRTIFESSTKDPSFSRSLGFARASLLRELLFEA